MQAIILAGGLGTRLQTVLKNLPKPMAPIGDTPFLAYLIQSLKVQGIKRVILSVCHLHETIQSYFGNMYDGVEIEYVIESPPRGTGGAIKLCLEQCDLTHPVFVLNGDTFVSLDYSAMYQQHISSEATLSMALYNMPQADRYGLVECENGNIIGFKEKQTNLSGLINAGIYLIQPNIFANYLLPETFSFEKDFLQLYIKEIQAKGFITQGYFIDIGVPEDYYRAQEELDNILFNYT